MFKTIIYLNNKPIAMLALFVIILNVKEYNNNLYFIVIYGKVV